MALQPKIYPILGMKKLAWLLLFMAWIAPVTLLAAEVSLPTDHPYSVTESGKPVSAASGIKFLRIEDKRVIYEVSSGIYQCISMLHKSMQGKIKS